MQLNDSSGFDIVVQNQLKDPYCRLSDYVSEHIKRIGNWACQIKGPWTPGSFRPDTFVEFSVYGTIKKSRFLSKLRKDHFV